MELNEFEKQQQTQNKNSVRPRYYKQGYRPAWEEMPEFKGWLKAVPGQANRAQCIYCQKTLHAHRLSLLKHTCTIRHQKASQLNFEAQENLNSTSSSPKEENILVNMSVELPDTAEPYYEGDDFNEELIEEDEVEDESTDVPQYVIKQAIDVAAAAVSAQKPPISTHVLDTAKGKAVGGLQVSLYKLVDGRWTFINEGTTNPDGRCADLLDRSNFTAGRYKLHFDVDKFFELRKQDTLYPFIEIVFDCRAPQEHYHIPLLLSPFGYTTYRGT